MTIYDDNLPPESEPIEYEPNNGGDQDDGDETADAGTGYDDDEDEEDGP